MIESGKPAKNTEFSPKIFRAYTNDWIGVTAFMLIGALIGLIFSLFFPPKYEAISKLTVNLEIVTSAYISEQMVDSQVGTAGGLVFYPDVIEQVLESLDAEGLTFTTRGIAQKTSIERQLMTTLIKVRDKDPQVAALIATKFAEKTFELLNKTYPHALALSEAKATQAMLTNCIQDKAKQDLPFCQSLTVDKTEQLMKETELVILRESPLSLGLTSAMNISHYQPAIVPDRPIAFTRSVLILAGALAGLVIALLLGELVTKEKERE